MTLIFSTPRTKSSTIHRTPIQQIVSFGNIKTVNNGLAPETGRRIEFKTVSWEEFDAIEDCPVQRNHEARAKDPKFQTKLENLIPPNAVGWSCVLTEEAEDPTILNDEGKTKVWPKDTEFITDIHTRREYWRKYSPSRPAQIMLIRSFVSSIGNVREQYYAHDNTRNVEKGSDLAYGAVRGLGYRFETNRMYKVMPISWASHYIDPKTFEKNAGFDGAKFSLAYNETYFKNETLFLDSFAWNKVIMKAKGSLLCASLLFLKKMNLINRGDLGKKIIKRLFTGNSIGVFPDGRYDAVTNALDWIKIAPSDAWACNWNTMHDLVGTFLYWMNQSILEEDAELAQASGDKKPVPRLQKCGYRKGMPYDIPKQITEIQVLFLKRRVPPTLPIGS